VNVARARELRKRMMPQEVKLWVRLRQLRALGFHFRRQAPLAQYILDFVCFRNRLVVEVDGGQHAFDDSLPCERQRTAKLASAGFRVLRFWNSDVDQNLDGVLETIAAALANPPTRPSELGSDGHPPHKGEGKDTRA
jgi:very-short-patch-repair endonuclease